MNLLRQVVVAAGRPVVLAGLALAVAALVASAMLPGCAARPGPSPQRLLTAEERERELRSFDRIWSTVRDKHWDPALGGLDWIAVRDSLRPRVETARTRAESRAAMVAMLATLGQTHFAVIPRLAYGELSGGGSGEADPGFDLRILEGRALVVSVEPRSPAAGLGVRPGWQVLRIAGQDVGSILEPLASEFAGKTTLEYILATAVHSRLRGQVGDSVNVRFLEGQDGKRDLRVPLVRPRGTRAVLGSLPPYYAWIESRTLPEGIGYIRLSAFFDPGNIMPAFGSAMESFMSAPGIILDLRGNPGGIGLMAMGMAGWLVAEEGRVLGVMTTRSSTLKFTITPRPVAYRGAVAVLVDGLSASTTEILAAGLQDIGRARVFGSRTAGAALPALVEDLPDGDGFLYAVANYISQGGAVLEGKGVIPDLEVGLTRQSLLQGQDVVLEAAAAWIRGMETE